MAINNFRIIPPLSLFSDNRIPYLPPSIKGSCGGIFRQKLNLNKIKGIIVLPTYKMYAFRGRAAGSHVYILSDNIGSGILVEGDQRESVLYILHEKWCTNLFSGKLTKNQVKMEVNKQIPSVWRDLGCFTRIFHNFIPQLYFVNKNLDIFRWV